MAAGVQQRERETVFARFALFPDAIRSVKFGKSGDTTGWKRINSLANRYVNNWE